MSDEQSSDQAVSDDAVDDSSAESLPEFEEQSQSAASAGNVELKRFGGVQVALTAQLGKANVTIKDMMELTEGAVVELDREIGQPVELVAQGVPLGNGEVVVVDDRFAIRIKEIY